MKTKIIISLIAVLCFLWQGSKAQQGVKIGAGSENPHSSAMLEVESANKGLLIPRMADHTVIQSPAEGLMVYNITDHRFWYYSGAQWQPVSAGSLAGNKAFQTLQDAATVNWDYSAGYNAKVTLSGNRTLDITNVADGDGGFLVIIQDGTGNHKIALPAGSIVLGGGGGNIILTSNPGAVDVVTFKKMGNTLIWSAAYDAN
ncbi:MAG: hypothetical protein HY958_07350 [Bacteroidia bacterium]|nr:hypothetical protein [Bacteroidia bacterium]